MIETAATHQVEAGALADDEKVDLLGSVPFLSMHVGAALAHPHEGGGVD